MPAYTLTCLICGTPFENSFRTARYCSDACKSEKNRLTKEESRFQRGEISEKAPPLGPTYAELREKIDALEAEDRAKGEPLLLRSLRQFSPASIVRECARVGCFNTIEVKGGRPPKKFCSKYCSGKHRADNATTMVPALFTPKVGMWGMSYDHYYPPAGIERIKMVGAGNVVDPRMPDRAIGF